MSPVEGRAKNCQDLEGRSSFYTYWAAEWGAPLPGNRASFWNISSSGLTELPRRPLESSFGKGSFLDGRENSRIPRKPTYWKHPCQRTLPQGNDPHTMSYIMSHIMTWWVVQIPLEEVFKLYNFHRPLIQVDKKCEQYICWLENNSRDSLWINGEHWPRLITIIPLKWNASKYKTKHRVKHFRESMHRILCSK